MLFRSARPDVGEGVLLPVTDWKLLTPEDYDRTCFHIEVDIAGTSIEHACNGADGKALSVYATNDAQKVTEFMEKTITLHFQKFVSVFGLLDAPLEFNQLASGWFNVKRHLFTSVFRSGSQDGTCQSNLGQDEQGTWYRLKP